MILYDYCRSSAAYRVRIALNLKGLVHEQIPVNLVDGEQSSQQHKQRNPQGLVPSLEENQRIFNQSLAIMEYLDEAYPSSYSLLPEDVNERARVRALSLTIACDIHPLNNLRVLKYLTGTLAVTEQQKLEWYSHWITEGFAALEKTLAESESTGRFCHGDKPTLADICLVPQVFNAKRFNVSLDDFPTINRIVEACDKLMAFKTAHPSEQADA
ncbi:MAG: maleylacetoacetate isomerase [Gammaproteobacteria bacterium]|nr:maleylacetoacetate isomerase [Gammaproteobacteria bacterium]